MKIMQKINEWYAGHKIARAITKGTALATAAGAAELAFEAFTAPQVACAEEAKQETKQEEKMPLYGSIDLLAYQDTNMKNVVPYAECLLANRSNGEHLSYTWKHPATKKASLK
ncbi:hypothetical protein HZB01_00890 [Candidatus Woesearchaeota archaeon]|nr:hypothetical protein [Candidatus Woesearchaeota archaeon]